MPKLVSAELEAMGLLIQDDGGEKRLVAARGFREDDVVGCVSALFFSSKRAAIEFLNIGSNAALLEGPAFQIDNLHSDEPTEDGQMQSLTSAFAIPVGAGRLLADYRGVRKFPNIVLSVAPHCGPNDGMLSMRVMTHNGCGIAAGAVVAADFGERWSRPDANAFSPARSFRGALRAIFDDQVKAAAGDPSAKRAREGEPTPQANNSPSPPAAAPASSAQEPAPKRARGTDQDGSASTAAGRASSAAGPADAGAKDDSGRASSAGTPADEGAAGTVLGKVDDFEVRLQGASIVVANLQAKNRKIFPKTVLATWSAGKLVDVTTSVAKEFNFKKASELLVMPKGTKFEVGSVSHFVAATNTAGLYLHGKFAAGKCPGTFAAKKIVGYVPAASESAAVLATVSGVGQSASAKIMWIVVSSDDKLVPNGLALVVTKQLLVPAGGRVSL